MTKNEKSASEKLENSKETKVIVKFPNKLELSLVQANELKHYELFQWLVALFLPIASGFWTSYSTSPNKALLWSAWAFTVVALLFIGLALNYRRKVFYGSVEKTIELKDLK